MQGSGALDRALSAEQWPSGPAQLCAEYELTRRQTLFWIDEQLYPEARYHHIVLHVQLAGQLDVARFRRAYTDTIAAFDQFRLVFSTRGGEPRQRFREPYVARLAWHDFSSRPSAAEAWTLERAARGFDFGEALFDGALLRLSAERHLFYFCQHHVISDGSSVALFVDDLARRYRGEPVAEHPSYALYLRHEQAHRQTARAERDAAHFAKRLVTGMPPLSLYGRTRSERGVAVDRSRLALGAARSERFAQLAKDSRIELIDAAMSRLVALATLVFAFVYRVGGARTLLLATPVPNRGPDFATMGGLLMEQTFLRVDIDDGETFSSLATKVRQELFAALRHAKHCVSDRGLSYVTLNLLRLPAPELPGLEVAVELAPLRTFAGSRSAALGDLRDTFGIHVIGFDESEPLQIGFDFHRETFDARLQERAKAHFLRLADALLDDLDAPLDGVALVDPAERAQILALGRGPEPRDPALDPLLQLREVTRQRSGYPAVCFAGKTLSYGELLQRVSQLATRLVQLDIQPGARVAFCLPRGPDELISMLAAWAVRAAYVPLDPSQPAQRLQGMLQDAAPRVLITQRALAAGLELADGIQVLALDEERSLLSGLPGLALQAPLDSAEPAYVLFTSGSTGRPKGVEVPRRAVANFLRSMADKPGLRREDRLLSVTTTTFDIALLELLLPLWVGATVQIAERETTLDPYLLRETIERDGITVLQATPTTWRLLLEAGYGRRRSNLKMLCGGEAISRELADRLLATGGELWNMYGPTETTVWSTLSRLAPDSRPISIGRPIDRTQVYVLGPQGALAPQGVTGELYIGGEGVALGYLARPDLTRERFVQNPQGEAGEIVYRTGDLARFRDTGELECLGRLDHQVKMRGFRIELGEIESCLRTVPGVQEVVVAPQGTAESQRLVAYWVGERASEGSLREAAARSLPSYMQPGAYLQLAALPLNSNGKVDRKQLPQPDFSKSLDAANHAFANGLELRMAALFKEVLGDVAVPPERDFFTLGGDSVRAMQLRRRIHESFELELPLAVMFDAPSVRRLVTALRAKDLRPRPLFLQLRQGSPDVPPLICVMGVALYRDLALALDTDRAVYGVHVPLELTPGSVTPSVEEIARLYTELILERVPRGPYHLAGLCFGGLVAFEVAHQLLARGEEVRTLAVFDGLLPRGVRYSARAHARALLQNPERLLARLRERASRLTRRLDPEPVEVSPESELDLALQGSEAAQLARSYDARVRKLALPFMLFRATEREEAPWYRVDARLGWGALGSPVTVHSVPGNHLSILQAGNVKGVADVLSEWLTDEHAGRRSRLPS